MDRTKLQKLIEDENDEREYQALCEAKGIINAIADKRQCIATIEAEIVKLRAELKALEVTQLDSTEVLGA